MIYKKTLYFKTIQLTELLVKRCIATKKLSSPRFTTLGENVTDFSNFSVIPHPESKLTKYQGFHGLKLRFRFKVFVKCRQKKQDDFSMEQQLKNLTNLTNVITNFPFRPKEHWNILPKIVTKNCFNCLYGYYDKGYFGDELRSQSFTSLMAHLRHDINRVYSFSRCLNGTFP